MSRLDPALSFPASFSESVTLPKLNMRSSCAQ